MFDFWSWFNQISPKLGIREITFRKTFDFLETQTGPIKIVETGCLRQPGNWAGDGQSTLLFSKYCEYRGHDSFVLTVDINSNATAACKNLVGGNVKIYTEDSVNFLYKLSLQLSPGDISLFYLDSYDVDFDNPYPSAAHHLKELVSIRPLLTKDTLIVIDDCPLTSRLGMDQDERLKLISPVKIGGKGFLVAEYFQAIGGSVVFSNYQAGFKI